MALVRSDPRPISQVLHDLEALFTKSISNKTEFSALTTLGRSLLEDLAHNIRHLRARHSTLLSIKLAKIQILPPEVFILILEYMLFNYSVFYRTRMAARLRRVCHSWNRAISHHPSFLRAVFLNTTSGPMSILHPFNRPIDLAWWVCNAPNCGSQTSYLLHIINSSIPVRSLHLVFDSTVPSTSLTHMSLLIHRLFPNKSFDTLTHLEIVNMDASFVFPSLHNFPALHSLVLNNSPIPFVVIGQPITVKHIHLQHIQVNPPQMGRYWKQLFANSQQLLTLRLDRVLYAGGQALAGFLAPRNISPVLDKLHLSVTTLSSLHVTIDVIRCARSVTHLDVLLDFTQNIHARHHEIVFELLQNVCRPLLFPSPHACQFTLSFQVRFLTKLTSLKFVLTEPHLDNASFHINWSSIFLDPEVRSIPPLLETVTFIQHDGFNALLPLSFWLDQATTPPVAFSNLSPHDPAVSRLFFETESPSHQSLSAILDAPQHPSAVIHCIYPQDRSMVENPVQPFEPEVCPLLFPRSVTVLIDCFVDHPQCLWSD
jgi:hypothetical protein